MRPSKSGSGVSKVLKFQSTHPIRDATRFLPVRLYVSDNFNPRIPLGMRPKDRGTVSQNLDNFNPRIPLGMRLGALDAYHDRGYLFQSTHPIRDATVANLYNTQSSRQFQSTHPIRDATFAILDASIKNLHISIHASH